MKLRELLQTMLEVQKEIGTSVPFICGGVARDKYLDRLDKISDIDITTGDSTIEYLSQQFAFELKKKYNLVRKTMNDGHSSIFIGNVKMDFSSNFIVQDIEKLLIKQGVTNPTNMQKELFSRDFTCNSLLLSFDLKKVVDITKRGFTDIKEKKIKTCLSPDVTLVTNKNRVIRAVYLACKLGFDIDNSIIEFVKQNPESVKIASTKSLSEKTNEAFKWDPEKASYLLTKMNLWNYIPITENIYPHYMQHLKGGK
jgi:tRNA nucleotidyltransferase/poly(A) polymerase